MNQEMFNNLKSIAKKYEIKEKLTKLRSNNDEIDNFEIAERLEHLSYLIENQSKEIAELTAVRKVDRFKRDWSTESAQGLVLEDLHRQSNIPAHE
jgi:hypothetical protein